MIKTYLDWLTSLPWNNSTEDEIDIPKARQILDEDHYDLEKIKDRILEYLAVRKLKQRAGGARTGTRRANREPILCFVGPPGVGKTSLAQSIARALGRKFTRMSLGGVRDEAEIRGHRRTYIGAMPGRIIQAIRRAGHERPGVRARRGRQARQRLPRRSLVGAAGGARPGAEQHFRDHYLDVAFDLSKVMFIATANMLDTIPAPLRDRMEILELAATPRRRSCTSPALPGAEAAQGARPDGRTSCAFDRRGAAARSSRHYTREAGVRNLEREIGTVVPQGRDASRRGARRCAPTVDDAEQVREYLGRPRFFYESWPTRTEQPGVATGVGVTPVGGDIMFIEATRMPGKGRLTLTGQLGDVMKESAQAALSLRALAGARTWASTRTSIEGVGHPHPRAGGRDAEGRSVGGRHDGDGAGLAADRRARCATTWR